MTAFGNNAALTRRVNKILRAADLGSYYGDDGRIHAHGGNVERGDVVSTQIDHGLVEDLRKIEALLAADGIVVSAPLDRPRNRLALIATAARKDPR